MDDSDGYSDQEIQPENPMLGCRADQFWLERSRELTADKINFKLETQFIPDGFLRMDVWMRDARHILLFSAVQEALLGQTETIYLDKTFMVIRKPFEQIFSISVFVKDSGGKGLQRERARDYAIREFFLFFCL